MWDENKFFRDFISETDKVKPDEDFVRNIKQITLENSHKRNYSIWIRYGASFAAVICIIIGFILWNGDEKTYKSEIESGKLSANEDEKDSQGKTEIITIKTVIECIEDESTIITDNLGNELTENDRNHLIDSLTAAVSSDYIPKNNEKYTEYKCEGVVDINIKIYNSGYLLIEETGMFYKIK